jgi:hypothetical protein
MRVLSIATTLLLLLASGASAQFPYEDNASRAYRHYLNSPYSMRTYSSLEPGHSWSYTTPLERGRFWETPSYYHERMSPRGREAYGVPPVQGGYIERRPLIVYPPVYVYPPPPRYPW